MNATAAAENLLGLQLAGEWTVFEKLPTKKSNTPAQFSVGYLVKNQKGTVAFCKALDWSSALESEDFETELKSLLSSYEFERDLLERCRERRMNRIVHAIASGNVAVPNSYPPRVSFLIFDLADGDGRDLMDSTEFDDPTEVLRMVKHCAVALGQLHRARVTHQDVKPANLLTWRSQGGWSSKLGDLGRAFWDSVVAPHDDLGCPGDINWAAPELIYRHAYEPGRSYREREMGDLYSLGSLLCFAFTGLAHSALLAIELDRQHRAIDSAGDLPAVLPVLVDAHERAVTRIAGCVPERLRELGIALIADMCHPDPRCRGALSRRRGASGFLLERYVSKIEVLSKMSGLANRRLAG